MQNQHETVLDTYIYDINVISETGKEDDKELCRPTEYENAYGTYV